MTLRPHGQEHFFDGLALEQLPDFAALDALHLDSINLGDAALLPQSLTTLEWQSRNGAQLRRFLPKLKRLAHLEYLMIGHSEFTAADLQLLISLISNRQMPQLQYLVRSTKMQRCSMLVALQILQARPADSAARQAGAAGAAALPQARPVLWGSSSRRAHVPPTQRVLLSCLRISCLLGHRSKCWR